MKTETVTEIVQRIELYRYCRRHSEQSWYKCGAQGQNMHNLTYLINVYLYVLIQQCQYVYKGCLPSVKRSERQYTYSDGGVLQYTEAFLKENFLTSKVSNWPVSMSSLSCLYVMLCCKGDVLLKSRYLFSKLTKRYPFDYWDMLEEYFYYVNCRSL